MDSSSKYSFAFFALKSLTPTVMLGWNNEDPVGLECFNVSSLLHL